MPKQMTYRQLQWQLAQLSAVLVAVLKTTGPVTLSKEAAERRMGAGDTLHYDKHEDGRLTVRVASVQQQDAAASERQSPMTTSLPVERPVRTQQNKEDDADGIRS